MTERERERERKKGLDCLKQSFAFSVNEKDSLGEKERRATFLFLLRVKAAVKAVSLSRTETK